MWNVAHDAPTDYVPLSTLYIPIYFLNIFSYVPDTTTLSEWRRWALLDSLALKWFTCDFRRISFPVLVIFIRLRMDLLGLRIFCLTSRVYDDRKSLGS